MKKIAHFMGNMNTKGKTEKEEIAPSVSEKPHENTKDVKVICGDSYKEVAKLPENSIDAIVCDPPYMIGFMGKSFDHPEDNIAGDPEFWKLCLRVLKPGGHLLSFGGSRTEHRMTCAIEDAGFEIRDKLTWVFASGFPKSHNIEKALQKKNHLDADKWRGMGTALKPAVEYICLARRPLSEKTIVENCIKHGTGALGIDGCRIPTNENITIHKGNKFGGIAGTTPETFKTNGQNIGRFPANLCVTGDALNDGEMTKSGNMNGTYKNTIMKNKAGIRDGKEIHLQQKGDSGSKSRYFSIDVWAEKHGLIQCPKASKKERGDGNTHSTVKPLHLISWLVRLVSKEGDTVLDPFAGSFTTGVACKILGRKFIGIEQEEEYCAIGRARIEHIKQNKLF